ncbi:hypothetical protein [Halobaculum sp. P14]|uniref:hypothetical protein n=1 Tax=Halobaculum sp. P14 TaxID=3421638 RepID=UPI003EBF9455
MTDDTPDRRRDRIERRRTGSADRAADGDDAGRDSDADSGGNADSDANRGSNVAADGGGAGDAPPDAPEVSASARDALSLLGRAASVAVQFLRVFARVVFIGVTVVAGFLSEGERDGPFANWFLLSGSRWAIIGALEVAFFIAALGLAFVNVIGVQNSGFVSTMFSTIIAGLFSFVPIVITVNSLAMSSLSESLAGITERIDNVADFREQIAALDPELHVTPTNPAAFVEVVTQLLVDAADDVEAAAADLDDPADREVAALLSRSRGTARAIREALDGRNPAVFDLLVPMMRQDYAEYVNRTRSAKLRHDLPADADAGVAELQKLLTVLDVTRHYFKTMYLQQELANLSRLIAYSGMAAFVGSVMVIMVFAGGFPPGGPATPVLLLVAVGLTVAFLPFAILFAYVVRIATVIKRTSAPGAFTPNGEQP